LQRLFNIILIIGNITNLDFKEPSMKNIIKLLKALTALIKAVSQLLMLVKLISNKKWKK